MKRIYLISILVLSVFCSQAQTIKHFTEKDGVESQIYTDCIQDGNGNIWFAGLKGISKWDGAKFIFIDTKGSQLKYNLLLDKNKNILIYNINSKILSKTKNDQLVDIKEFSAITSDANGIVWGIMDKAIYRYDGNNLEKFCSDKNTSLSETFLDSKGNTWLASGEGIYRIKNKDFIRFSKENGIDGSSVSAFFEDSKGKIWVLTRGSGIFCYNNDKWIVYTKNDGLFSNDILQIVEDKKGLIWAAHYKDGISYYDGTKWTDDKRGTGYNQIISGDPYDLFKPVIKIDSLNNVWFGCRGGALLKFNGTEWEKLFHINAGSDGLEIYISKHNKNNIWLKSCGQTVHSGIGLNKYELNTNKLTNLSKSNVYQIVEGDNGVLWFLTNKGLSKYDDINGYSEVIDSNNSLMYFAQKMNNLLIDKTGNLWAGFKGGIYCITASK